MGIRDLKKYVKKFGGYDFNETKNIDFISGWTVGIDVSNYAYKYLCGSGSRITMYKNFINFNKFLISKNINPIFIFDGKSPEEKINTTLKRRSVRKKNIEKLKILREDLAKCTNKTGQIKLIKKIKSKEKNCMYPLQSDYINLRKIFKKSKINYILSECEADMCAAALFKKKIIKAIISEDTDHLTYGIGFVIKKISIGCSDILILSLDRILKSLNITHSMFVDICILLGCDYSSRVNGFGIVKTNELISKYKNIETINRELIQPNYYPEDLINFHPFKAKRIFTCDYHISYCLLEHVQDKKFNVDSYLMKKYLNNGGELN